MRALEEPLGRVRPTLVQDTPLAALAALALVGGVALVAMSESVARIVGLAIAHGALLGTALTWTAGSGRRERWAPLEAALVLGAAAGCASLHPVGALGYAVVPVWLAFRRPAWLGARGPRTAMAVAGGAVFGLLLGAHLLVNTALTFGYRVRTGPLVELAEWWAYDLGANVLTAELFFRGALFERAYRRWSFAPAAAVSTAAAVIRYLADPLLPHSIGIAAGATFYMAVLGAGSCWLVARTGSLAPSLAAASFFFGAYRLLAPR
jgi:membrane protease YdiL (CAAX protease family)